MLKAEISNETTKFENSYDEAQELLYMFYYSSSGDYKKEIYSTLINHLNNELK